MYILAVIYCLGNKETQDSTEKILSQNRDSNFLGESSKFSTKSTRKQTEYNNVTPIVRTPLPLARTVPGLKPNSLAGIFQQQP